MTRKKRVLKERADGTRAAPAGDAEEEEEDTSEMSLYKAFIMLAPIITFLSEALEIFLVSVYANHFRGLLDRTVLLGCAILYAVVAGLRSLFWGEDSIAQPDSFVHRWTADAFLQRVPVVLVVLHSRSWGIFALAPILVLGIFPWLVVLSNVRRPKSAEVRAGMIRVGDADRALFIVAMFALCLVMLPDMMRLLYPIGRARMYEGRLSALDDVGAAASGVESLRAAEDDGSFIADLAILASMPVIHFPAFLGMLVGSSVTT
eukprot:scaffold1155_cov217-Pinguiococcus_pyrenoidosus.AAC.5